MEEAPGAACGHQRELGTLSPSSVHWPLCLYLYSVQLFSFLSLTFHTPTFIHSFIFFPSPTLPCFLSPLSSLTQIFSILSIADITEKNSLVDPALVSVVFGVELCVYVVLSWAEQDSCP